MLHALPILPKFGQVALGVAVLKCGEVTKGRLDPESALNRALGKPGSAFQDQSAREVAARFARPSPTREIDGCRNVIGLRQVMADLHRWHGEV